MDFTLLVAVIALSTVLGAFIEENNPEAHGGRAVVLILGLIALGIYLAAHLAWLP